MKSIELRPDNYPDAVKLLNDCKKRHTQKAHKGGMHWRDLTPNEHTLINKAKADEQGGLCGYCECRLVDDEGNLIPGKAHADHFYQKSKYPDKEWEWSNLVLSCTENKHCGFFKDREGRIPSEQLINPHTAENPRELIAFIVENERRITAMPVEQNERAAATIKALNLNDMKLSEVRRGAFREYEALIREILKLSREEQEQIDIQQEIDYLLASIETNAFCSSMLCCARNMLGVRSA